MLVSAFVIAFAVVLCRGSMCLRCVVMVLCRFVMCVFWHFQLFIGGFVQADRTLTVWLVPFSSQYPIHAPMKSL